MIPHITLQRTSEVLGPRVRFLIRSLSDALEQWNGDLANVQVAMDASARAIILNRLFYHNATRHLATDQVEFREDQQQRYLIFDEEVILRAKHLDRRLEARNYRTRHAKEWVQQFHLPEITPVSRLHFGYRLDVTGTALKDVFITLPNGDPVAVNDWVWQMYGVPIPSFGFQQSLFGDGEVFRYDDFSRAL